MDFLLTCLTLGGIAWWWSWSLNRSHGRRWAAALEESGFTNVEQLPSLGSGHRVTGERGPVRLEIASYRRGRTDSGAKVVAFGIPWCQYNAVTLSLRPEGFGTGMRKTLGARGAETGDASFDARFFVQGTPALVCALLDAGTRWRLEELRGAVRLEFAGDGLEAEISEQAGVDMFRMLPRVFDLLCGIGERAQRQPAMSRVIADNARHDPEPGVRIQNLIVLAREYASAPVTTETLRAAREDTSAEIRLAAHTAAGLGATGLAVAEAPLLPALASTRPNLRLAAAQALRRAGTVAAVLPLTEAMQRHDDGEFRSAARQAIAEIQSRVTGATPGQLSLAAVEAGQVSLAAAEAGAVSIAGGPAGQLSMKPDDEGKNS
jgi:hypothetical protein